MARRPRRPAGARGRRGRRLPWCSLLTGLALAAGLALAGLGAWLARGWLTDPATLPIRRVVLQGTGPRLSASELRRQMAPVLARANFLTLDVDALRRILETSPWVGAVNIRRQWPDTLVIALQQRQAVARWGRRALVSRSGVLMQVGDNRGFDRLPLLQGPEDMRELVLRRYATYARQVRGLGHYILRFGMDRRHAVHFVLENGVEVRLGRRDHAARMARLVHIFPRLVADGGRPIRYIDLRYDNGLAVARAPAPAQDS